MGLGFRTNMKNLFMQCRIHTWNSLHPQSWAGWEGECAQGEFGSIRGSQNRSSSLKANQTGSSYIPNF